MENDYKSRLTLKKLTHRNPTMHYMSYSHQKQMIKDEIRSWCHMRLFGLGGEGEWTKTYHTEQEAHKVWDLLNDNRVEIGDHAGAFIDEDPILERVGPQEGGGFRVSMFVTLKRDEWDPVIGGEGYVSD